MSVAPRNFIALLLACLCFACGYEPFTEARISSRFSEEQRAVLVDGIEDLCRISKDICIPWRIVDERANVVPATRETLPHSHARNRQGSDKNIIYIRTEVEDGLHSMGISFRHELIHALRLDGEHRPHAWSLVADISVRPADYRTATPLCFPQGDAVWLCAHLGHAACKGTCPDEDDRSKQPN